MNGNEDGLNGSGTYLGQQWDRRSDNGIVALRELTKDEQRLLNSAVETVSGFSNRAAWQLVDEMYQVLVEQLAELWRTNLSFGPGFSGSGVGDVGGSVAVWLHSAHMFLEHTRAHIIRSHGRRSNLLVTWDKLRGELEESNLAFRVCGALRNYLHGSALPVRVRLSDSEAEDGSFRREVTLTLDLETLLKDRTFKGALPELERMDENLELIELLRPYQGALSDLQALVMREELPSAIEAASVVKKFAEEARGSQDGYEASPVTFTWRSVGDDLTLSDVNYLPVDRLSPIESAADGQLVVIGSRRLAWTLGWPGQIRPRMVAGLGVLTDARDMNSEGHVSLWTDEDGGWGGRFESNSDIPSTGPARLVLGLQVAVVVQEVTMTSQDTQSGMVTKAKLEGVGRPPPFLV